MLKQHFAENQQQLPLRTTPPAVQSQELETEATGNSVRAHLPAMPHRFSPLYLSWQQLAAAFVVPLLWALFMAGVPWVEAHLQNATRYGESWLYLRTATFTLIPWLLCLWLGYRLRNRRIAVLSGAFAGAMFYLATKLDFWIVDHFSDRRYPGIFMVDSQTMEFRWLPMNFREMVSAVLFTLLLAVAAAAISQIKHGRRTMYDKDSNR